MTKLNLCFALSRLEHCRALGWGWGTRAVQQVVARGLKGQFRAPCSSVGRWICACCQAFGCNWLQTACQLATRPWARHGPHEPGMCFQTDRKSTRLNSSHLVISYAVFCLKNKKIT